MKIDFLRLEIQKILGRRICLSLLIATAVLFPAIIVVGSHMELRDAFKPPEVFLREIAYATISFSQTIVFIPIWIIFFVGSELTGGHAQRVSFLRGRRFYVTCKIAYCVLVGLFFSMIGLISIVLTVLFSPAFSDYELSGGFLLSYFIQATVAAISFSLLLLCFVFVMKSPIITFVFFFIWTFVETASSTIFRNVFEVELKYLPFKFIKLLYLTNGVEKTTNYYNPFEDDIVLIIPTLGFVLVILGMAWFYFPKSNLKPLSD